MGKKVEDYHNLPGFERKELPTFVKSYDEDKGIVKHFVAIIGNVDSANDRIMPGAFQKTISERRDRIRVLDQHQTDSVTRIVGKPLDLEEVGRNELTPDVLKYAPDALGGLLATTQYATETSRGHDVFKLVKGGFAPEGSIGYDPILYDFVEEKDADGEDRKVRELKEIRLWEYSNVIYGCNSAALIVSAKSSPTESKPAPDVTENTIRIRVRDPGDFEEDSFRTINIGQADQGIKATVGKLKGESAMTVQSYVFDREKWDVDKAQAWVDEHKKDAPPDLDEKQTTEDDAEALVPTEQDESPYRCECLECGHVMESEEHCRDIECPKCGGAMRRAERPGPGKGDEEPDEVSAVWTTAYVNNLPDSAFLYIAPGGEKDEEGKTKPRNLRYFPYKDAGGGIDLPHLRNAIARIPQSNAPGLDDVRKNSLQERARRILEQEQEKSQEPAQETKEPTEAQVFAAIALENIAAKLSPERWEHKAAMLAAEKLRYEWGEADEGKVAELECKVGRVLAARNAQRISAAMTALLQVLEDAGIDIPGFGKEPAQVEEEEEEKDYALDLEILGEELDLLEME